MAFIDSNRLIIGSGTRRQRFRSPIKCHCDLAEVVPLHEAVGISKVGKRKAAINDGLYAVSRDRGHGSGEVGHGATIGSFDAETVRNHPQQVHLCRRASEEAESVYCPAIANCLDRVVEICAADGFDDEVRSHSVRETPDDRIPFRAVTVVDGLVRAERPRALLVCAFVFDEAPRRSFEYMVASWWMVGVVLQIGAGLMRFN
jgi:hypothetical protein